MIVDTHVHVWTLDERRFPFSPVLSSVAPPTEAAEIQSLEERRIASHVDRVVLVQPSVYGWNNDYLLRAIAKYPGRYVGVALVDLESPSVLPALEALARLPAICGVRLNLHEAGRPSWLLDHRYASVWDLVASTNLTLSLQLRVSQIFAATEFARTHLDIPVVIDSVAPHPYGSREAIVRLDDFSRTKNAQLKLIYPGRSIGADYSHQAARPLYTSAIRAFGAERLSFGSDVPYGATIAEYAHVFEWFEHLPFVTPRSRHRILQGGVFGGAFR